MSFTAIIRITSPNPRIIRIHHQSCYNNDYARIGEYGCYYSTVGRNLPSSQNNGRLFLLLWKSCHLKIGGCYSRVGGIIVIILESGVNSYYLRIPRCHCYYSETNRNLIIRGLTVTPVVLELE